MNAWKWESPSEAPPDGEAEVCGADGALRVRGQEQEVVRLHIPASNMHRNLAALLNYYPCHAALGIDPGKWQLQERPVAM